MNEWRATAGLVRATIVAATGFALGILLGSQVMVVLATPFLLWATFGLVNRPSSAPRHRLDPGPHDASRGAGHDLAPAAAIGRRCRTRHPRGGGHPARRAASGERCGRRPVRRQRSGARGQPAPLGPTARGRREGRPHQHLGRLPLGPRARGRERDLVVADHGAVRLESGGAAAGRAGGCQSLPPPGRRVRVRRDPWLPSRRPATADQLAGLAADRRPACRHGQVRGGQRSPHRRRRARRPRPLRRHRRGGQQPGHHRPVSSRTGRALHPHRRPGVAAHRRWSERGGRVRRGRSPPASPADHAGPPPARSAARLLDRPAPVPGHRGNRRTRAVAHARRGCRHRHGQTGPARPPGHGDRHAAARRTPRCRGGRLTCRLRWLGGCGSPIETVCWRSWPGPAARSCPGRVPARSTWCCIGLPAAPRRRGRWPDDLAADLVADLVADLAADLASQPASSCAP